MTTLHVAASEDYRRARAELLAAEEELRAATARVAALRATLPPGPEIDPATPLTTAGGKPITLDDVLGDHPALITYTLPFDDTSSPEGHDAALRWADALDTQVPHLRRRAAVAIFAPAMPHRVAQLARHRGWRWASAISTQPGDLSEHLALGADPTLTVLRRDRPTLRVHWHGPADPTWPLLGLLPTS